jgi:anthranilate phosphoribosyltransferase
MAQVLGNKGVDGFVFRGDDGLDELTLTTTTQVLTIGNGAIESGVIDPPTFGISYSPIESLVGGDATENAAIAMRIFEGERGAPRDAVLLNAASAIAAYNNDVDSDLQGRFEDGIESAKYAIDSGAAKDLLERWAKLTQALVKS